MQVETKTKVRDSNFELLRLISQFYIVFYHIFIHHLNKMSDDPIFLALLIPLHIGVIVFVLISGYYSIRPTSKGLLKFLSIFFVFTLPEVVYKVLQSNSISETIDACMMLSTSHNWFIITYLQLFLFAPILNKWWDNSTTRQKWYVTLTLAFSALYLATTRGDPSLSTGKNLVNFSFLYFVGRLLNYYKDKWKSIKYSIYITAYLAFNICIVVLYMLTYNTAICKAIFILCYPYYSPLLLLNAMLMFCIVGKMQFKSRTINYLASSSLAIYLLHRIRPYMAIVLTSVITWLSDHLESNAGLIIACAFVTLVDIAMCIAVDKMFTPLWKYISRQGDKLYQRLGF